MESKYQLTKENKQLSVQNSVKNTNSATPLNDNRPTTVLQKKQVSKMTNQNSTPIQLRKAKSRGDNKRTYKLPATVANHIFVNNNNGSGFHSIARNPATLRPHVVQTDDRDRNTQAYLSNHVDNGGRRIVARGKSMFPDNWSVDKVTTTIEQAFTKPVISATDKVRVNRYGTTEANNRELPDPVKGKANGLRIEGLTQEGALATAYPIVQ
ncbi:hypothetical protein GCM10007424_19080 [Flavobacterium suaedae]|uniref:Bacterial EndoU nuclease domain-containing protein n=1 Tax=Flavobacterium suaedae TaxID=1767027 RepID=A0ABQ1JWB5_9FLAO|nr:EndoU domain-containing protein [Flavobacterium suaedae]GGB79109.1 hypothetical protein GCM10007424_19080 [Flavobacterium suaedae]